MHSWSTVKSVLEGTAHNATSLRISSNADKPALLTPEGDITAYYSLAGDYISDTGSALKELELSGLRGRGGAGFPVSCKGQVFA